VINGKMIVLFSCGAVLAASSVLEAQDWGSEKPRDGACFYEDTRYRGDYFCVKSGEDRSSLPSGVNDRISSIRIYGRAEVMVYKDRSFKGSSKRFDRDIDDLRGEGWNDRISSFRVRGGSSRGSWGSGGSSGRHGDPERIVRRAYQDILEREPDDAGMRIYRSHIIDDDWSEEQVREALRKSPEYREKHTMTRAKAEQIVRQAYLSVLKREPDAGSRGYVDKVMRNKWTQQDVERELRKSPEYRTKKN